MPRCPRRRPHSARDMYLRRREFDPATADVHLVREHIWRAVFIGVEIILDRMIQVERGGAELTVTRVKDVKPTVILTSIACGSSKHGPPAHACMLSSARSVARPWRPCTPRHPVERPPWQQTRSYSRPIDCRLLDPTQQPQMSKSRSLL
jgi:hypothetical protein